MSRKCALCDREGVRGFTTVPPQRVTFFTGESSFVIAGWDECTARKACLKRWKRFAATAITADESRRQVEAMGVDAS